MAEKEDPNEIAARVARQTAANEDEANEIRILVETALAEGKNPAAVLLGRRGGLKGGKARAAKLSARRRKQIAKKAAMARWKSEKR